MIDAVGATPVRIQAMRAVVPGGRVVFIGLHDEESALPANYLIRQEITVTGSFAYTDDNFAQAVDLLVRGGIRPSSDWLEERRLNEGPAAFAELVDGKARAVKIVLTMDLPTDKLINREIRMKISAVRPLVLGTPWPTSHLWLSRPMRYSAASVRHAWRITQITVRLPPGNQSQSHLGSDPFKIEIWSSACFGATSLVPVRL